MSVKRRTGRLILISATAAALGIGLAAPALADDFNPQPDPPGKPIAITHLSVLPPDPVRTLAPSQAHQRVITRLGGTDTEA